MHRLYLIPTLLINVVIIFIPAALTIALAFCRWDGIGMPVFVGLANFRLLLADRVFWMALGNNIIWTAIFLTVPIAMGLLAATIQPAAAVTRTIAKSESVFMMTSSIVTRPVSTGDAGGWLYICSSGS